MNKEKCIFCKDPESTYTHQRRHPEYGSNILVILKHTLYSYAIVGLGALTPGYILILPRRHHTNLSQLKNEELNDFINLKEEIGTHLTKTYGDALFFEHGASLCNISSGACIDHAHLHAIPSNKYDFTTLLPSYFETIQISSFSELSKTLSPESCYLYLEKKLSYCNIYTAKTPIESQFFRRIWAQLLGKKDEYDYSLFWGKDNMEITFNNFIAREAK